jgi:hypothetical protein
MNPTITAAPNAAIARLGRSHAPRDGGSTGASAAALEGSVGKGRTREAGNAQDRRGFRAVLRIVTLGRAALMRR